MFFGLMFWHCLNIKGSNISESYFTISLFHYALSLYKYKHNVTAIHKFIPLFSLFHYVLSLNKCKHHVMDINNEESISDYYG